MARHAHGQLTQVAYTVNHHHHFQPLCKPFFEAFGAFGMRVIARTHTTSSSMHAFLAVASSFSLYLPHPPEYNFVECNNHIYLTCATLGRYMKS